MVGQSEHYGIDIRPCHQFAKIMVPLAIVSFVMGVDLFDQGLEVMLIHVASGYNLAVGVVEEAVRVPVAHTATAHHTHVNSSRRRGTFLASPHCQRHQCGQNSCAGSGQETAATEA